MLSNPADRKKLLDCVKELSDSMLRAEAEKDLQKEAIADMAEELNIPKKYIAKVAAIYHKQNFSQIQSERDDIDALYEAITSPIKIAANG